MKASTATTNTSRSNSSPTGNASRLETGGEESTLVVMHDATGEFAGFTHIDVAAGVAAGVVAAGHRRGGRASRPRDRALDQGGEHPGRPGDNPDAQFVDTWNAGSNKWMLAINDDLGFRPYIWYTAWQAKIADIKEVLSAK